MHWGEYRGANANQQNLRVLILCESHHTNADSDNDKVAGKAASYPTSSVVDCDYIQQKGNKKDYRNYILFMKIEQSFGFHTQSVDERREFWNKVYFGNYIPVLCGVRDNAAKKTISAENHREEYNSQLFSFVNEHQIDVIFCFSRLVYKNLPSLEKEAGDTSGEKTCSEKVGGKRDYISFCEYAPDAAHSDVNHPLKKRLIIYGMRHPSTRGGFRADNYKDFLSERLQECIR